MLTYQDLIDAGESELERMKFVRSAISYHQKTDEYKIAEIADKYNKHENVTINEYQKLLYTVSGETVPDNWSANYKMACRHFHRFITQENQFLLGNGVTWTKEDTADKIGNKKFNFDNQLQKLGKYALIQGVSFGFFNLDHVEVFQLLEFVPLFDETNGSLSAGIRYWQLSKNKPLRATLYEMDGYTEYIWDNDGGRILKDKTQYKLTVRQSVADGLEIISGENYPSFPIVPLWGNPEHQSEIVGLREQIDCYDLIKSGFANTVDEASIVYWTLQNAGGMDDVDLAQFVERMKTLHAAVVSDDGASAESHVIDVPVNAREALLERLDRDLYKDAMALDVERIAAGATTATQIRAAYEPLNSKCDDYEYCVLDFVDSILELAGVEDSATFTRSMIVNTAEDIQTILSASNYLPDEYVTKKILTVLGDGDSADEVLAQIDADELTRYGAVETEEEEPEEEPTEV